MSVGYVMSGWENGWGLPVVCPPQSFLSQKADGQREISWLFRGFEDTAFANLLNNSTLDIERILRKYIPSLCLKIFPNSFSW